MIITRHKWHGDCDILTVDGKYCTIRFFDGTAFVVKRVQKRMISEHAAIKHNPCLCNIKKVKQFGKCLHCHIQALRKWAQEIQRLKNDVGASLCETNKARWDGMNSQQKKIAVFRAMELGFISWQIKSYVSPTNNFLNT